MPFEVPTGSSGAQQLNPPGLAGLHRERCLHLLGGDGFVATCLQSPAKAHT